MGEGNDPSRVLKVLKTSKAAEERIKALEDLSKSYVKCSSSEELAIVGVLTICFQEESCSVLRDLKWRTNICRVGSSRLPVIQKRSSNLPAASAWYATCLRKQAEESKAKDPRQAGLSKLVSELNSFSAVVYTATECSFLMEKPVISSVGSLISESLGLVKVLGLSSTAKNDPPGAEILKVAVDLLQAALRVVSKMNHTVNKCNEQRFIYGGYFRGIANYHICNERPRGSGHPVS